MKGVRVVLLTLIPPLAFGYLWERTYPHPHIFWTLWVSFFPLYYIYLRLLERSGML